MRITWTRPTCCTVTARGAPPFTDTEPLQPASQATERTTRPLCGARTRTASDLVVLDRTCSGSRRPAAVKAAIGTGARPKTKTTYPGEAPPAFPPALGDEGGEEAPAELVRPAVHRDHHSVRGQRTEDLQRQADRAAGRKAHRCPGRARRDVRRRPPARRAALGERAAAQPDPGPSGPGEDHRRRLRLQRLAEEPRLMAARDERPSGRRIERIGRLVVVDAESSWQHGIAGDVLVQLSDVVDRPRDGLERNQEVFGPRHDLRQIQLG